MYYFLSRNHDTIQKVIIKNGGDMDTLTSIKVFHQVVAVGSFTKAAQALNMSVAMTSKHVAHLERSLNTKLLHRNSRNIHLTEAGEQYHRQSLYALEILGCAEQTAKGATNIAQGVLKITMPSWFANPKVARWLAQFQNRYPNVVLDLSMSNHMVDLVANGFDLALRLSNEPKPSLITRPLGVVEFYPVATPQYLNQYGTPATPDEFNMHHAIQPSYVKMDTCTVYHHQTNEAHTLCPKVLIYSDDTVMTAELIRAGAGVGYMPSWVVEEDLQMGRLVRLLPDYHLLSVNLYAAYVDRAFLSAKVRAFIDFWVEKCAN